MTISSMTGFGRAQADDPATGSIAWELRSVNGKGLDIRLRLPPGCEGLEGAARERLSRRFRRGNIQAQLVLASPAAAVRMSVNRALLDQLRALAEELAPHQDARIDRLLTVRGVVEPEPAAAADADTAARDAAILAALDSAAAALDAARRQEGEALLAVLSGQLDAMAGLAAEAGQLAAAQPEAIRARLEGQLDLLLAREARQGLDPQRLAQEVALLAAKADIREELDRLAAHVEQARSLLADGGAVGRRLDFLCQEFNREANTLCSKSADVALTRLGLDLKVTIEQFREQVQNVE
ncbi:MAG: YicC family protein [Thalassobaculales bacterium]